MTTIKDIIKEKYSKRGLRFTLNKKPHIKTDPRLLKFTILQKKYGKKAGRGDFLEDILNNKIYTELSYKELLLKYVEYVELLKSTKSIGNGLDYHILRYGDDIGREKYNEKQNTMRGENNPGYQHGGKLSPFSKKFVGHQGLSEDEKEERISATAKKSIKTAKDNDNHPTTIEYYIKRGMSEDQAKEALSERQATFSLDKCISKYGKVEGRKKWVDRQDKWQKTLNDKPIEEIDRINRAKMLNGRGYSKISQELFIEIYKNLNEHDKPRCFFAVLNKKTNQIEDKPKNCFHEFFVHTDIGNFFLDFKLNNKVIEFDGDYWHGIRGNKKREDDRNAKLKSLGYDVLHISESSYNNNKEETIQQCLTFLTT